MASSFKRPSSHDYHQDNRLFFDRGGDDGEVDVDDVIVDDAGGLGGGSSAAAAAAAAAIDQFIIKGGGAGIDLAASPTTTLRTSATSPKPSALKKKHSAASSTSSSASAVAGGGGGGADGPHTEGGPTPTSTTASVNIINSTNISNSSHRRRRSSSSPAAKKRNSNLSNASSSQSLSSAVSSSSLASGQHRRRSINTKSPSIQRAPKAINSTYMWAVAFAAGMGGLLFGYEIGIINQVLVLPSFIQFFHLGALSEGAPCDWELVGKLDGCNITTTENETWIKGTITSSFLWGCVMGAAVVSYLADLIGRKNSIITGGIIYTLGGTLQAAAYSLGMLIPARAMSGISVGLMSMSVPLYIAETSPTRIRGRLTTVYQLMITFGILLASCVNGIILSVLKRTDDKSWRLAFALQTIPGVTLFFLMLPMPRSPRWLAEKGMHAEGQAVIAKLRAAEDEDDDDVVVEYRSIVAGVEFEKRIGKAGWSQLFQRGVRRRVAIGFLNQFFQQWTGINVILYYGATLFKEIGFGNVESSVAFPIINAFINFISTVPGMWGVERFGRRPLLIYGGLFMCLAYVIIFTFNFTHALYGNWIALFGIYFFTISFACTWGPVVWTYQSEIFPLRIRAKGTGLSTMSNWFWNAVIALIQPYFYSAFNNYVYLFFGIMCLVMSGYSWMFIPETRNKTLEEMDEVFQDSHAVLPNPSIEWGASFFNNRPKKTSNSHGSNEEAVASSLNEKVELAPVAKPAPALRTRPKHQPPPPPAPLQEQQFYQHPASPEMMDYDSPEVQSELDIHTHNNHTHSPQPPPHLPRSSFKPTISPIPPIARSAYLNPDIPGYNNNVVVGGVPVNMDGPSASPILRDASNEEGDELLEDGIAVIQVQPVPVLPLPTPSPSLSRQDIRTPSVARSHIGGGGAASPHFVRAGSSASSSSLILPVPVMPSMSGLSPIQFQQQQQRSVSNLSTSSASYIRPHSSPSPTSTATASTSSLGMSSRNLLGPMPPSAMKKPAPLGGTAGATGSDDRWLERERANLQRKQMEMLQQKVLQQQYQIQMLQQQQQQQLQLQQQQQTRTATSLPAALAVDDAPGLTGDGLGLVDSVNEPTTTTTPTPVQIGGWRDNASPSIAARKEPLAGLVSGEDGEDDDGEGHDGGWKY